MEPSLVEEDRRRREHAASDRQQEIHARLGAPRLHEADRDPGQKVHDPDHEQDAVHLEVVATAERDRRERALETGVTFREGIRERRAERSARDLLVDVGTRGDRCGVDRDHAGVEEAFGPGRPLVAADRRHDGVLHEEKSREWRREPIKAADDRVGREGRSEQQNQDRKPVQPKPSEEGTGRRGKRARCLRAALRSTPSAQLPIATAFQRRPRVGGVQKSAQRGVGGGKEGSRSRSRGPRTGGVLCPGRGLNAKAGARNRP